ncbi:hypothetical protein KZZ52_13090 [Dactylosporangium sp. AC04546]|uniref:hypothetical protein n=1 Tax=Dactylosporangium sp. AC04546 TaxID=2862460 RepID=UPI001EE03CC7|nr:hypothetical protein [Dactylosporangium sp. AC04546]WVK86271.1 hypothetical protein KZZ52_13090 [Dactylosporangium sp. AC04546]
MNNEALLDAGAVLLPGAEAVADTVDTLTTRTYRHPVLGERSVVRLVPRTLGPAEDLTMEFLGFAAPEEVAEVGVVRQQALGFPAWALVHDPANGHHALALVKDIERLSRVAKSRIGPARDGFNELGERLARSVPHFLPTFYEEAARAFLVADSTTYAATMFGKAREAERLFALTIDEERQHTVFLEFALAGALTAKALSAHARDLAGRSAPTVAYERFRRLCVERTLGGMPPYAQMHVDLRRLAKAAKVGEEDEERLIAELLEAPSILRAPGGFWTAYRPALIRLARRDPQVRGQLLGIFPRECPGDVWLDILDESGASDSLTGPAGSVPAGAEPSDGPAGWLSRLDKHRADWRRKRLPAQLRLVERMAERLRVDGVPVDLGSTRQAVDLDVVDLCLELEVPLAEFAEDVHCPVDSWVKDEAEGRRDLAHVGRFEPLLGRLGEAVEGFLRTGWGDNVSVSPERVATVVAVPGLRSALHGWLDRLAGRIVREGLTSLAPELARLALVACPEGLAVNPEAIRRITEHDLGPILGASLRAGVFDEYGWPALEDAVARLVSPGGDRPELQAQWPQLMLRSGEQVVVAGADGVELEHLLRIPPAHRQWRWRQTLRYVDGQLLVTWDADDKRAGYWTGAPDDVFEAPEDAFSGDGQGSMALPGGGRTGGWRPLHPGDRAAVDRGTVATDGLHYWVLMYHQNDYTWRWREFDPATGDLGRASMPAFFEAGGVAGFELEPLACRLRTGGPEIVGSPLGQRDGLIGWRLRRGPGGAQLGEGADGRTFTEPGQPGGGTAGQLIGAIRFPGADTVYGMLRQEAYRNNAVVLTTADGLRFAHVRLEGESGPFAEGTPLVPPPPYWHYLRPRDEAGSAALRGLTDATAGELLAAALAQSGAEPDADLDAEAVRKLVADALPGLAHPALLAGVAGVVRHAARSARRLHRLTTATAEIAARSVAAVTDPDADKPSDTLLNAALSGLIPGCYDHGHEAVRLFRLTGAALTGREPDRPIKDVLARADVDWFDTIGALPAVLVRAVSPLTPAEHRTAILDLLEIIADSGLIVAGARFRRMMLRSDTQAPVLTAGEVVDLGDGRRLVATRVDKEDGDAVVLELATSGRSGPIPGHTISAEHRVMHTHGIGAEQVTAFVAAARANGPLPYRPELVRATSVAAGISLAEATVLLTGPRDKDGWEQRPEGWELDPSVTPATVELAIERIRRDSTLSPSAGVHAVLLPEDPSALWTTGPALDRMAAWRTERVGVRTPVDDGLILELHRSGSVAGLPASEFLHGVANAETCRWLQGNVDGVDVDDVVISVVRSVPWLVRRLPVADPIRVALPRVLELAGQRLRDPETTFVVGHNDTEAFEKFVAGLGTPVTRDEKAIDTGLFFMTQGGYWNAIHLRPARVAGVDDPFLGALIAFTGESQQIVAARAVLAGQLADWIGAEPVEDAHDPSRSVPELVATVAERHGLSADAATVYLQLLALPDPTDRNVATWTGWKPARLKKARAELAGTDLVVEAKRPRAGRSLFLPGGWLALGTPHVPLERWKLPLLIGDGEDIGGLGVVVPVAPAPRLFELAWGRITAGDLPRFEELTTNTKGRR